MHKKISASVVLIAFLLLADAAHADLVVDSTGNNTTAGIYDGTTSLFNITVEAGDFLVLAHANNKRNNGNNDISAMLGASSLTGLSSADTGGGETAWIFYSEIVTGGTFALTMDSSSTSTGVSHSTSYWVVDGDSGESVEIAGTDTSSTTSASSLDLDFTFASTITNGLGFASSASSIANGETVTATGWSVEVPGNGKRRTFSNADVDGASLTSTFSASTGTPTIGLAGIVLTTSAVPEPSSTIVLAFGFGLFASRRRRK